MANDVIVSNSVSNSGGTCTVAVQRCYYITVYGLHCIYIAMYSVTMLPQVHVIMWHLQ